MCARARGVVRAGTLAAIAALLLVVAPTASAATAPSLSSPENGVDTVSEGGSITFEWTGSLQGDADTLDRSFFRLEIAAADDVPSGQQSTWDTLEKLSQTAPGETVHEVTLGAPPAGAYKWRVCAWGVVDDLVANEIEQLPSGCSAARSMTIKAAATSDHTIGEIKHQESRVVQGTPTVIERTRPSEPTPAEPTPVAPAPAEPEPPASFQEVVERSVETVGSAVDLSPDGSFDESEAGGFSGALAGGFGTTLPLVPIPFWTLALLLACVPVARVWRRSVLGMFEWPDGSEDGRGSFADLDDVAFARDFKAAGWDADDDASPPARERPDQERVAA